MVDIAGFGAIVDWMLLDVGSGTVKAMYDAIVIPARDEAHTSTGA
jgi:hypothetical protein